MCPAASLFWHAWLDSGYIDEFLPHHITVGARMLKTKKAELLGTAFQPATEEPVDAPRQHEKAPSFACRHSSTTVPGTFASIALRILAAAAPRNYTYVCGCESHVYGP